MIDYDSKFESLIKHEKEELKEIVDEEDLWLYGSEIWDELEQVRQSEIEKVEVPIEDLKTEPNE